MEDHVVQAIVAVNEGGLVSRRNPRDRVATRWAVHGKEMGIVSDAKYCLDQRAICRAKYLPGFP